MKINNTLSKINEWRCLGSGEQCYVVLYAIVRSFQIESIVEIGTHQGASSITFCQAILDNNLIPKIWTVDSWEGFKGNELSKNLKQKTMGYFKEAGFDEYITMIEGDSKIILPDLMKKIKQVDLCFIDGDHNYDGVITDFNNCKEYTNKILFHDTPNERTPYLKRVQEEGWSVLTFPTRFFEGDNHLIGISFAYRN